MNALALLFQILGGDGVAIEVVPSEDLWYGAVVEVMWRDVPAAALSLGPEEYVCKGNQDCDEVVAAAVWFGVFPEGSSRKAIGPQTGQGGVAPWIFPSPSKWYPIITERGSVDLVLEAPPSAFGNSSQLELVMFSNGTAWPVELAVSQPVTFARPKPGPRHMTLARTGNASQMRISFTSSVLDPSAQVRWAYVAPQGSANPYIEMNVTCQVTAYKREQLCAPPANAHGWGGERYVYSGVIQLPGAVPAHIIYTVGSETVGRTDLRVFYLPSNDAQDTLRITVAGDTREAPLDEAHYHWTETMCAPQSRDRCHSNNDNNDNNDNDNNDNIMIMMIMSLRASLFLSLYVFLYLSLHMKQSVCDSRT